jgi:hypothetical protein
VAIPLGFGYTDGEWSVVPRAHAGDLSAFADFDDLLVSIRLRSGHAGTISSGHGVE